MNLLGFIDDAQLARLYQAASVFLFPSFEEGFGIPVLEAMADGVPVVTSNVSSMPEVGGEAALYVDPHDPADIAQKVVAGGGGFSAARGPGAKGTRPGKRIHLAAHRGGDAGGL